MPHNTAAEVQDIFINENEQTDLEEQLKIRLKAIAPYHLPALTLSDILKQTPRAQHFSNIPPDIQFAFFLRNRAIIDRNSGGEPIKDEALQNLDITRVIFFYRLNETRQFQRFHDIMRWNTAIFAALLALPFDDPPEAPYPVPRKHRQSNHGKMKRPPMSKDTCIPPAARRFMISYLAAVLEHHNSPGVFEKREAFIKIWKSGVWDLFVNFGPAQKKLMKNLMKGLSKEWEAELDRAMREMGRDRYDREFAKFVGSIIPGRKDQSLPAPLLCQTKPVVPEVDEDVRMGEDVRVPFHEGQVKKEDTESNELLEALRISFNARKVDTKLEERQQITKHMSEIDACTVTDLRYAIAATQKIKPCDMLPVLLKLFSTQ
jgi:hypothetical protein